MRFRNSSEDNGIPTIDLIPMLTVMMGVLAFFVVVSVSMGSEQLIQVDLPSQESEDASTAVETLQDPFIIEMDETGQRLLNGQPIAADLLTAEMEAYLARNTDQTIYLVPSRSLPYEQVMQFLGDMREVGGDRVSLALQETPAEANLEATSETSAAPTP